MANITYLLGAGASVGEHCEPTRDNNWKHGGLPLVKDIPKALERLKTFIETAQYSVDTIRSMEAGQHLIYQNHRETLIRDIDVLVRLLKNHSSIDTLARKLYLNRNEFLPTLKFIIDVLFLFEQMYGGLDKRYDLFLGAIIKAIISPIDNSPMGISFPSNIKIITWNYDIQLECSIANYSDWKTLGELRKYNYVIGLSDKKENPNKIMNQFCSIKLNGSAGNDDFLLEVIRGEKSHELIIYILSKYVDFKSRKHLSRIRYGWERNQDLVDLAGRILLTTDILVVIGYSFPTFNRDIDKQLLKAFFNEQVITQNDSRRIQIDKNKRIDLQVPQENLDSITTRIQSLLGHKLEDRIIQRLDISEFFIPFEFD